MKNYIITMNELEIISRRLKRLYIRKEKIELALTNTTSKLKEVIVSGGSSNDKIGNYIVELEDIKSEIKELESESKVLKEDLEYMDNRLSNINDIKEQVFVMFYIKGMKPKNIAPKIPCDLSTVYKKIKEINRERKAAKKIKKNSDRMVL